MTTNGFQSLKYFLIVLTAIGFFVGVGMNWNKILQVDAGFENHLKDYDEMEKRDDRQDCDIVELKGDVKDVRNSQNRMEMDMREQRTEAKENFKELKQLIKDN